MMIAPNKYGTEGGIRNIDTAPYSLITIFLCHIVLWVFANVAPHLQKLRLVDTVLRNIDMRLTPFPGILRRAFGLGDNGMQVSRRATQGSDKDEHGRDAAPIVLFRSAAEMLTRLGT